MTSVPKCRTLVVALVLAMLALAACGGDDERSTPADSAGTSGASLYAANCAACHGDDLRGTGKGPSHLSVVYERGHHPDDSFRRAIAQGVTAHHWEFGAMAPVEGLSDAEVDAIIAYVREVQDREGLEPYPPE